MNHTVSSLTKSVSEFYGIIVEDLYKKNKKRIISHARQVLVYLIRYRLWMYCTEIAKLFPKVYSDHSGVSHAISTIKDELSLPNIFPTREEITIILELSLEKVKEEC